MNSFAKFKKFALRGNVIDMAVGFTVGAAFTTVVRSLVEDVLMPPIGVLFGDTDFSDFFFVLSDGAGAAPPYDTLAAATEAGAVTLNYGIFFNNVIAFLVVAVAIFAVVRAVTRVDEELDERFGEKEKPPQEPESKKCPYCRTVVDYRASRCPHCTSRLDERAPGAAAPS